MPSLGGNYIAIHAKKAIYFFYTKIVVKRKLLISCSFCGPDRFEVPWPWLAFFLILWFFLMFVMSHVVLDFSFIQFTSKHSLSVPNVLQHLYKLHNQCHRKQDQLHESLLFSEFRRKPCFIKPPSGCFLWGFFSLTWGTVCITGELMLTSSVNQAQHKLTYQTIVHPVKFLGKYAALSVSCLDARAGR